MTSKSMYGSDGNSSSVFYTPVEPFSVDSLDSSDIVLRSTGGGEKRCVNSPVFHKIINVKPKEEKWCISQTDSPLPGSIQDAEENPAAIIHDTEFVDNIPDKNAAAVSQMSNVYVTAIHSVQGKDKDELSFTAGQEIKQTAPANNNGMAFGRIKKGMLRKKICGLYPANSVKLYAFSSKNTKRDQ